jgi:methyl-accepting chemotaxis protein
MLNRVSINVLLKTVIAALGGAVVIVLSIIALDSWSRLNAASRAASVTDASAYLFTALHHLRIDRSSSFRDLSAEKGLTAPDKMLDDARAGEMPALKSALVVLQGIDFPDQPAMVAELADRIKRLSALHEESTAAMRQPKASRRAGIADEVFKEDDTLINLLDKLSTRLTSTIKLQDAFIDQLMELKQLAWIVRNGGGDASVVISNALGGRPMPPNAMEDYLIAVAKVDSTWAVLKDVANGLALPPRFSEAVAQADREFFGADYVTQRKKVLTALLAGQPPGVTLEQWSPMSVAKLGPLLNVAEVALDVAKDRAAEQRASALHSLIIQLALLVVSAVLAVVMMMVVSSRVSRPLHRLSDAMRELAHGDFTVTMPGVGRKDEVGLIASAAEAVVEKVGATIGNIKVAANEVTSASAEISTSTTDLSQRTEEQAASLEETSTSMEEISATVKKNAENARQANDFAIETSEVAEHGGAVVSDAVTAMARIEESSRKISDIIGVIDEIARQTNLLALNAAVEAARAGEAGRGFAVVASEVRSLAQRSSQAAKDIKDLITNSNSQVKDGVDLVNKAGESLNEIVASIKKVATIVADIANASMEQSSGIEQVNKALTQMDEVTQQNSALVEENAATAKTLEQQAKSMDERVAAFRLRAHVARATAEDDAGEPVHSAPAAKPATKPAVVAKPAPKRAAAAANRSLNGGGPVGRMQTALATAVKADDWKEF